MTNATPAGTVVMTVDDIKRHVNVAFTEFTQADATRQMAREDANAENERTIGVRESLLIRLANHAHSGNWSNDDTTEIVKGAIEAHKGNKKSSSLSTFASEVKLACDKRVRRTVADTFSLARKAFDAETADDTKDAPKPIHKAFSRCYHTAIAAFKATKDDGAVWEDAEDFTTFAHETIRNREIDYNRVAKRLKAIREELSKFHDDFPVDGIEECVGFLRDISVDDLKACRNSQSLAEDMAKEPEVEAPATNEGAPVEGVVDLDNFLSDALADQKAA